MGSVKGGEMDQRTPLAFLLSCFLAFLLSCFLAFLLSCFLLFLLSCFLAFLLSCFLAFLLSCFVSLLLAPTVILSFPDGEFSPAFSAYLCVSALSYVFPSTFTFDFQLPSLFRPCTMNFHRGYSISHV